MREFLRILYCLRYIHRIMSAGNSMYTGTFKSAWGKAKTKSIARVIQLKYLSHDQKKSDVYPIHGWRMCIPIIDAMSLHLPMSRYPRLVFVDPAIWISLSLNSHPVAAPHMAPLVMHYELFFTRSWSWSSGIFSVPSLARRGFETVCNDFFIFALALIAEIPT